MFESRERISLDYFAFKENRIVMLCPLFYYTKKGKIPM